MPEVSGLDTYRRSYELLTTGWLPGWAGLIAVAVLGALVCRQLNRELRRVRPADAVARSVMLVRVLIVGLTLWLLCQPLLLVTTRWDVKPELLVLVSKRTSMRVIEDFGQAYRKLDVLEALEQRQIENRNRAASRLERTLVALARALDAATGRLQADLDGLANGLPPRPGFDRALAELTAVLGQKRESLIKLRSLLPDVPGTEELHEEKAKFLSRLEILLSAGQDLSREALLVRKEARAHPDLLQKLVERLGKVAREADGMTSACGSLQAALDSALIPAKALAAYNGRELRRGDFANLAAALARETLGDRMRSNRVEYSSLAEALKTATGRQLSVSLSGALVLDDGSADLSDPERRLLSSLAEAGVPVHTVLVGADGVEPDDVGVVSVQIPGIAVAGRKVPCRAMVKARVQDGDRPRLVVRGEGEVLKELEIKGADRSVIEFSLRLDPPGRRQIAVEMVTDGRDAFPGNERQAAIIDVLQDRPRLLIVSNTLSRDFVFYRSVAESIPFLRTQAVLADPEIEEVTVGEEPGQLPETTEQWKSYNLVILLGEVPAGLPEESLSRFRNAVREGLQVLVVGGGGEGGWAEVLGLSLQGASPLPCLAPRGDLWLSFYALGQDQEESLARWRRLPEAEVAQHPAPPGLALLEGGARSPLQVFLYDQGVILFSSLRSMAPLRDGNAQTVNRLGAGLIELALRPWREVPAGPVLLPPQPTFGKRWMVLGPSGDLRPQNGLELVEESGAGMVLNVTDEDEVTFEIRGTPVRRLVNRLVSAGDFRLAARAAPLQELARLGRGRHVDLLDLPTLLSELETVPAPRSKAETYRLWVGWWPLGLMLLLVSAEYLLRRKAGRVM